MTLERNSEWYDDHYSRRLLALRVPGDALKDRMIRKAVAAARCKTVLDLGCGEGGTLDGVDAEQRVVGLDLSGFALRNAQRGGRAQLVQGNACHLPFADGSFDFVVAKDILEHVEKDGQILDEIARVSLEGAWVLLYLPRTFQLPNFSTEAVVKAITGYTLDRDVGHVRRYSPRGARELLNARGYRVEDSWDFVHFTLGVASLAAVLGNRVFARGGQPGSTGIAFRLVATVFKIVEVIGSMEARLMRRLPGAGFFVLARKES